MFSFKKFNWEAPPGQLNWEDIQAYKYRTTAQFQIQIPITGFNIQTEYVDLNVKGMLTIKKGYAWDGASGPTKDSKKSKRGSCVHDALYQLMRLRKLDNNAHREIADWIFYRLLIADKMFSPRAWIWWRAVRRAAWYAAKPKGAA